MPKLIYKPDGAKPREWELQPRKLLSPEVKLIERLTEWTFEEWWDQLRRGSLIAVHAVLWVLMRRDDPTLDPDAVVFTYDDVDVLPDQVPADEAAPKDAAPATPTAETTT